MLLSQFSKVLLILNFFLAVIISTPASEIAEKPVTLLVRTDKVACKPGEIIKVYITMRNRTGEKINGNLKVIISSNLDKKWMIYNKPIDLPPRKPVKHSVKWKCPDTNFWGCEAKAEMLNDKGVQIAMGRQVFVVSDNLPESSAHYAIISRHVYGWPSDAQFDKTFNFFASHAVPIVEMYCWTPSNWGVVVPDKDEWLCGQMRLKMTTKDLTGVVEHAHRRGMLILTYARMVVDGIEGYRHAKAHPEDVLYPTPTAGYNPAVAEQQLPGEIFDDSPLLKLKPMTDEEIKTWEEFENNLDKFSIPEASKRLCRWEMLVNCSRNETLDQGIDQYIEILKRYKFDGIRWDGHPRQYYHPIADMWMRMSTANRITNTKYDWRGKPVVPDDPDQENLRIYRRFSQRLRTAIPSVLLGYNIQVWNKSIPDLPELTSANLWSATFAELLKGAIVLDEKHFHYKPDGTINMHSNWNKTIKFFRRGNELMRRLGAYHYVGGMPTRGSHPFFLHVHSLCYAIGVRPFGVALPYGKYPPQYRDFLSFAQRYAKYFFHRHRLPLFSEHLEKSIHFKIDCDQPLVYKPFSYHLCADGKYSRIIHLWNKPVVDKMNLLKCEEPPMIDNAVVTINAVRGLPTDKAKTFVLSPEWPEFCRKVKIETSGRSMKVKVPPFRYWAVVISQFPLEPIPPKIKN